MIIPWVILPPSQKTYATPDKKESHGRSEYPPIPLAPDKLCKRKEKERGKKHRKKRK
jgi:hypothetical protein